MLKPGVTEIIQAQEMLQNKYREENYKRLITKMKAKVEKFDEPELIVLAAIVRNDRNPPTARVVALACMGE